MGKKIAEGMGTVLGWALGILFLIGMWYLSAYMVRWSYIYEWVSWTVTILLWLSLTGWWYNSHKKKQYRENAAILVQVIDEIRDNYPDVDDEMNRRGITR